MVDSTLAAVKVRTAILLIKFLNVKRFILPTGHREEKDQKSSMESTNLKNNQKNYKTSSVLLSVLCGRNDFGLTEKPCTCSEVIEFPIGGGY